MPHFQLYMVNERKPLHHFICAINLDMSCLVYIHQHQICQNSIPLLCANVILSVCVQIMELLVNAGIRPAPQGPWPTN